MTDDTRARSQVTGSLRSEDGTGVVRMDCRYDTDIADLWSALTDPARLVHWLGEFSGDMELGGTIWARFTSSWEGTGRVDVCEAPRRVQLTMSSPEDGDTVIEAQLTVEHGQTRLVIEERGLPLGEIAAYGAGWQAHIEDLAAHLEGLPRTDWLTRWKELSPTYTEEQRQLG